MSISQTLFIGPYAEFSVPADKVEQLPPTDEGGDRLFYEVLMCNWGLEDRHTDSYCYMPCGGKPDPPSRTMLFCGQPATPGVEDLTGVDRQAEMSWFAEVYAEELRVLSKHFGSPPAIRWGLIGRLT